MDLNIQFQEIKTSKYSYGGAIKALGIKGNFVYPV
jgi:hypothetical protein